MDESSHPSFLPLPLATFHLFSIPMDLLRWNSNVREPGLCVWLLSLSIMLASVHTFTWYNTFSFICHVSLFHSFVLPNNTHYVDRQHFIHSLANGLPGGQW